MTVTSTLGVLVAVPRALVREAILTALAGDGVHPTGTASVDEVAPCAHRLAVDVAVLALEPPERHPGFDLALCRAVVDRSPGCRVLLLSDGTTPELARAAVAAGASGVFDQAHGLELLSRAVRAVAAGEVWLPRVVIASIIQQHRPPGEHATPSVPDTLTARERDVLRLLAAGKDHHAIATELDVSPHTARTHIRNVMRKLGAHSRLEAVALARSQPAAVADQLGPSGR